MPPGTEDLWEYAKEAGYDTSLLRKVQTYEGHFQEQGVDELLHLKIANALLDFDAPQCLVLVTGDGSMSEFGTSFLQQVTRAVKRGWDVELWSWADGCSSRLKEIAARNSQLVSLNILDPFYATITFLKKGTHPFGAGQVALQGRVVQAW